MQPQRIQTTTIHHTATVLNYDSDQLEEMMAAATNTPSISQSSCANPRHNSTSHSNSTPLSTSVVDYATELAALKSDLQSLRTLITTAVEQLKLEITSMHATPDTSAMETEANHSTTTTPEISDLIADLKHDIATIAIKMRAKFQQQATLQTNTNPKHTSVT